MKTKNGFFEIMDTLNISLLNKKTRDSEILITSVKRI